MRARRATPRTRGFALIVVLWVLVLIAAIGTYILANARTETAIAQNVVAEAQAEALADSGVALTVFNLLDPLESRRWALDGEPHALNVVGGTLSIRLIDEASKVNPSLASEALLAGLFEAVGTQTKRARQLAATVSDWVDRDDVARREGAERQQYVDAGLPYLPPNTALRSLDELGLVLGVTPAILAAARPYMTIFTEQPAPAPATAPPLVRRAIAIADRLPPTTSQAAPQGEADPDAPAPVVAPAETGTADAVIATVEVAARSARGGVFVRRAVVRVEPGEEKGYVVLDWGRGEPQW